MPDILAVTAWDVPEEGFKWVDAYAFGRSVSSTVERFLTPKAKASQGWRRYWPLADAVGLFRAFADTETSEGGIIEFAEKFGALGLSQDIEIPSETDEDADTGPIEAGFEFDFGKGESFGVWEEEILGLRHVLKVWDALQVMSVDDLQAWFRVEDFHGALRASYDAGAPIRRAAFTHERSPQTTMQEFQWYLSHAEIRRITEDPSTVALSFIRTLIEARLREQVGARIVYQDEADLGPLGVNLVPKSLLGAIWLQAAQAIEANKAYGRCRQCRSWFEVPPELVALGKRKDLGYCSVACRENSEERDTRGDGVVGHHPPTSHVDMSRTFDDEEPEPKRALGGSR
jgi:hypothetical protein